MQLSLYSIHSRKCDVISNNHVWLYVTMCDYMTICDHNHVSELLVVTQHWRQRNGEDKVQQAIATCTYFTFVSSVFILHTEIFVVESSQLTIVSFHKPILLPTCQTLPRGNCKTTKLVASENRCILSVYMPALHEEIHNSISRGSHAVLCPLKKTVVSSYL